jgi:hypothetical protein
MGLGVNPRQFRNLRVQGQRRHVRVDLGRQVGVRVPKDLLGDALIDAVATSKLARFSHHLRHVPGQRRRTYRLRDDVSRDFA